MSTRNRILWTLLRVLAGVGIFGWLAWQVNWRDSVNEAGVQEKGLIHLLAEMKWGWAGTAALLIGIPHLLVGTRWWLLMRVPGIPVSLGTTVKLNLVGALFNNFGLGAGGGDLAKAYHVTQHSPGLRTEAVTTIFLDRILGLMALCLLATGFIYWNLEDDRLRRAGYFIIGILACCLLATVFFVSHRLREARWFEWILSKLPFQDLVRRMDATVRLYRHSPGTVAAAVVLSWGGHVLGILGTWAAAHALRIDDEKGLFPFFCVMPVIWAITSVPLTPGAVGVQEGVFVFFQASLGCPPGGALGLSLLVRVLTLVSGLPGAVVLLMGAYRPAPADETAEPAPAAAVPAPAAR